MPNVHERAGLAKRRAVAAVGAITLALSLASCAPEPGDDPQVTPKPTTTTEPTAAPNDGSGDNQGSKGDPSNGGGGQSETEWGGHDQDDYEFTTELPASFPSDLFVMPAGLPIYDAGERSGSKWFVVLRADTEASAVQAWDSIIAQNGFTVVEEFQTSDAGKYAALEGNGLSVEALTIAADDGSVRLNYEVTRR